MLKLYSYFSNKYYIDLFIYDDIYFYHFCYHKDSSILYCTIQSEMQISINEYNEAPMRTVKPDSDVNIYSFCMNVIKSIKKDVGVEFPDVSGLIYSTFNKMIKYVSRVRKINKINI